MFFWKLSIYEHQTASFVLRRCRGISYLFNFWIFGIINIFNALCSMRDELTDELYRMWRSCDLLLPLINSFVINICLRTVNINTLFSHILWLLACISIFGILLHPEKIDLELFSSMYVTFVSMLLITTAEPAPEHLQIIEHYVSHLYG